MMARPADWKTCKIVCSLDESAGSLLEYVPLSWTRLILCERRNMACLIRLNLCVIIQAYLILLIDALYHLVLYDESLTIRHIRPVSTSSSNRMWQGVVANRNA